MSSSSYRSNKKFNYSSSSPFDEALSKPLINDSKSQQKLSAQLNQTTNHAKNGNHPTDMIKPGQYPSAVYSNKLSNIGNLPKRYAPPPPPPSRAFHVSHDDEEQPLHPQTTAGNTSESFLLFDQQQQQEEEDLQRKSLLRQMDRALLQERHMESQTITNQMRQILEINRDLSFLVSQQQESIDIIEENALETHDNAERGKSYLEQANRIMQKTMRGEGFMRVFFWVLAVGGLLIALVLFLESL